MKSKSVIFVLLALCLFCSCTIKTQQNNKRTVSVSGSGTVEVEADSATLILSVITRAKDVAQASQENALKMQKVQNSIIESGIPEKDITTEGYSVYQERNYVNGRSVLGDYNVTNRIKVYIKDLSLVSNVIDLSLKNGANELTSLQYGITNKELFVKQARILAVQNAQEAANLIAGTSGAVLGKILTVSEDFNNFGGRTIMAKAAVANDQLLESATVATPLNAGKSSITITVHATYELK